MTEANTIRKIEITRTIDAKPAEVYRAWTDPEHFTHWFGAPLDTISMDVRPGGSWQATLPYEGTEIPFFGAYRTVEENAVLSFSLIDPQDPHFEERKARGEDAELVTITFTDKAGKTEMVFEQTGHLTEEQATEAKQGWEGWFDALAAHVTKS